MSYTGLLTVTTKTILEKGGMD